ncbi:class I SAM-dependent methyltransferase [Pseudohalocynthiibacter aestuariivivens]|nr:class I SAM-dependent methyltransferase [Pseudohalocynthiibacter aestuariivivens]QIE45914.1 class I SAM-dependent methyltransferase [Pseudohalocynthiibacter aestuariivivens]
MHPRLSLSQESGLTLSDAARIAVFAPRAGMDLSPLEADQCHLITGMRPDFEDFEARGFRCDVMPEGRYDAAVVMIPRAKAEARALIALAASVTDGPVVVDGTKTDGIESALKDMRKRAAVSGPINKAHGKLFWFDASAADLADWVPAAPAPVEAGFMTAPGVFSADGIDPASRYLAEHLPQQIGAHVVDLGAGWGYLSSRVLEREKIARVDLVEANHAALECARRNVTDERAQFHWADALRWQPDTRPDAVIMNPPFHIGRDADPKLGAAFIAASAAMLKPQGQLWLVANRHLPYERDLVGTFAECSEVAGDTKFKLLHARRPTRQRR